MRAGHSYPIRAKLLTGKSAAGCWSRGSFGKGRETTKRDGESIRLCSHSVILCACALILPLGALKRSGYFGFHGPWLVFFLCFFFFGRLIKVMPCDRAVTRSRRIKRHFVFFSSARACTLSQDFIERVRKGDRRREGDRNRRGRKKKTKNHTVQMMGRLTGRFGPQLRAFLARKYLPLRVDIFPTCRRTSSMSSSRRIPGIELHYLIYHLATLRCD